MAGLGYTVSYKPWVNPYTGTLTGALACCSTTSQQSVVRRLAPATTFPYKYPSFSYGYGDSDSSDSSDDEEVGGVDVDAHQKQLEPTNNKNPTAARDSSETASSSTSKRKVIATNDEDNQQRTPDDCEAHKTSRTEFIDAKSNSAEVYGWIRGHVVIKSKDEDTLSFVHPLGHGSLGVVEAVHEKGGKHSVFVRKRIQPRRQAALYFDIVREEVRILKLLTHPHIVTLIGPYEDQQFLRRPSYCILMAPVGESDLEHFLETIGEYATSSNFATQGREHIRHWFACLVSALRYMHASGVRHQDIKPSNIIHKGGKVFFTDFSSSSTFNVDHTTSTDGHAHSTLMYGAPEMVLHRTKHGTTSDVFSLGCVFCDMLAVMGGQSVSSFQDYLREEGDGVGRPRNFLSYGAELPFIHKWFDDSRFFEECVSAMLRPDRTSRPSADKVIQILALFEPDVPSCRCEFGTEM